MVRLAQERVLLIGDAQRDVQSALTQAIPGAQITSVATVFDGIAELTHADFSTVLASVEPIERRPEAALRTLRSLAGESRLVLFGHPTLEVLARKMLEFGCDDYVITPANPDDLQQVLGKPVMRIAAAPPPDVAPEVVPPTSAPAPTAVAESKAPEQIAAPSHPLLSISVEAALLDALMQSPHDAPAFAIKTLNAQIAPANLVLAHPKDPAPTAPNAIVYSQAMRAGNEDLGTLHLILPEAKEDVSLREALARIAPSFAKLIALQERHNRLQKLAITDELTGLYNARYFRHFLTRIVDRAKAMRFPVTLLLFDIDDFKKYNDSYGHAVGDEILKQTAQLMRRCCREHDLVARIGGDEFAVVFWDKEGPRKPLEPGKVIGPSRPPSTPLQIFERFKRLAASADFSGLGTSGRGRLSVSGGLAVFPYDATDVAGLIKAADEYLMFHAKQAGKNSIYLVNGEDAGPTPG